MSNNVQNDKKPRIKLDLYVEEKEFVNDEGKVFQYTSFEIELEDEKISLIPRSEDKKLLKHLLKDLGQNSNVLESSKKDEELSSLSQLSISGVKK